MSVWTHIVGNIRLDDFSIIVEKEHKNRIDDIKNILGPILTFSNGDIIKEEDVKLPIGSEGSIKYSITDLLDIDEHATSSIFRWSIGFFGDLRSYNDLNKIEQWLSKIAKEFEEKGLFIRDAVFKVEVECEGPHCVLYFDDNEEIFKKIYIREGKKNNE